MKPRIEFSDKGHATIWESGSWQEPQATGRGCVVSGPEGEPLQVIYSNNPQTANFQFLFFANPSQLVATAFVRAMPRGQMKYDLTLNRIKALTTDLVSGEAVLRPELDTIWSWKQIVSNQVDIEQIVEDAYRPDRVNYQPVYKKLILAAVEKATTPGIDQRLFWGTPRKPR